MNHFSPPNASLKPPSLLLSLPLLRLPPQVGLAVPGDNGAAEPFGECRGRCVCECVGGEKAIAAEFKVPGDLDATARAAVVEEEGCWVAEFGFGFV